MYRFLETMEPTIKFSFLDTGEYVLEDRDNVISLSLFCGPVAYHKDTWQMI